MKKKLKNADFMNVFYRKYTENWRVFSLAKLGDKKSTGGFRHVPLADRFIWINKTMVN